MPTDYVSDFEEVSGQKKPAAAESAGFKGNVQAKVITAPAKAEPKKSPVAQTKAPKAK